MSNTISLVVNEDKISTKCVYFIKKKTGEAAATVISKIAQRQPLFVWHTSNYRSLITAIEIYKELAAAEIPLKLYLNGDIENIGDIENMAQMMLELAQEQGENAEDLLMVNPYVGLSWLVAWNR